MVDMTDASLRDIMANANYTAAVTAMRDRMDGYFQPFFGHFYAHVMGGSELNISGWSRRPHDIETMREVVRHMREVLVVVFDLTPEQRQRLERLLLVVNTRRMIGRQLV